jgi:hypothetical protein
MEVGKYYKRGDKIYLALSDTEAAKIGEIYGENKVAIILGDTYIADDTYEPYELDGSYRSTLWIVVYDRLHELKHIKTVVEL